MSAALVNRASPEGRAAAVYLVLAGVQRGLALLLLPFISNAMQPTEYGLASMLTVSALLLTTVFAAPLEQLVFRLVARGEADREPQLRVVAIYVYVFLPAAMSVAAVSIWATVDEFLGIPGAIWAVELIAVGFMASASYFALPCVRAQHDLRRFVWLATTSITAIAGSRLLLVVAFGLGVWGWALSDLFSGVLSAAVALALVRPKRAKVSVAAVRAVAAFTIPLIPHRASFWALSSLSRPVLAVVSTMYQVGLLAFGLNLASVANLILAEVNRAVLPNYSKESFPAPGEATLNPAKYQLLLAFLVPSTVGAGLALVGGWLLAESYWPAFPLVGMLLIGQAGYGLYLVPMNYTVQTSGATRWSSAASVVGAVTIFTFTIFLGSYYGAVAVAIGTTAGFVLMALVALLLTRALKLEIAWRSIDLPWYWIVGGIVAIAMATIALFLPVFSAMSVLISLLSISIVVAISAHALVLRRIQP